MGGVSSWGWSTRFRGVGVSLWGFPSVWGGGSHCGGGPLCLGGVSLWGGPFGLGRGSQCGPFNLGGGGLWFGGVSLWGSLWFGGGPFDLRRGPCCRVPPPIVSPPSPPCCPPPGSQDAALNLIHGLEATPRLPAGLDEGRNLLLHLGGGGTKRGGVNGGWGHVTAWGGGHVTAVGGHVIAVGGALTRFRNSTFCLFSCSCSFFTRAACSGGGARA